MPKYGFKAYDGAGRLEHGEIDAETPRAALDAIARRGLFALEIINDTGTAKRDVSLWHREVLGSGTLPLAAQATLARELATLIKADIPIDEVLRIVALQPRIGRATRQLVEAVEADVVAGSALSQAMAAQRPALPDYFWRLVGAGEAGGALPKVMAELSDTLEQSVRLRKQLLTAMLYPVVLLVTALISVAVIMTIMVPALLPLFRDAGAEPPFLLAALGQAAQLLSGHWPIVLAIVAGLVAALIWATRDARVAGLWHRAELRLPFIASHVQRGSTAQITRTLAMLLRNGVPMLEALETSAGVVRNRVYAAALRQARSDVNRGGSILASLSESALFPPLALRLIGIGEQTGQLAMMLTRIADVYEHDQRQQLDRLLAFATPAITIVIGCLVGLLMVTVFSAIIGLNEVVLR